MSVEKEVGMQVWQITNLNRGQPFAETASFSFLMKTEVESFE